MLAAVEWPWFLVWSRVRCTPGKSTNTRHILSLPVQIHCASTARASARQPPGQAQMRRRQALRGLFFFFFLLSLRFSVGVSGGSTEASREQLLQVEASGFRSSTVSYIYMIVRQQKTSIDNSSLRCWELLAEPKMRLYQVRLASSSCGRRNMSPCLE